MPFKNESLQQLVPGAANTISKSFRVFQILEELKHEIQSIVIDDDKNVILNYRTDVEALEDKFYQEENEEPGQLVPRLLDIFPPSVKMKQAHSWRKRG